MSSKINRLAVCICGEYRTWPKAHTHIFTAMEHIAEHIDYYFVTWDKTNQRDFKIGPWDNSSPVTTQMITDYFSGRNLINYQLVDPNVNDLFNNYGARSFFYVAYLSKIANIFKRKHEQTNGFIYDQVIELRPDLYIPNRGNFPIIKCNDFEYIAGKYMYSSWQGQIFGVRDLYLRFNSAGHDAFACRFDFKMPIEYLKFVDNLGQFSYLVTENHFLLFQYLSRRNMLQSENFSNNSDAIAEVETLVPIRANFPDNFAELTYVELKKLHDEFVQTNTIS